MIPKKQRLWQMYARAAVNELANSFSSWSDLLFAVGVEPV